MTLRKMLSPFIGIIGLSLYTFNIVLSVIYLMILLILSIFVGQKRMKPVYFSLPVIWAYFNQQIFRLMTSTEIELHFVGENNLDPHHFYLITANHQSWTDILVLFQVFYRRVAMLKFFAKKQLMWLPLVGQMCWFYGFPFLHRHTPAELKKHPEWRKKDIDATKKACERFKESPGCLVIFSEGTRFSEKKRINQQAPYEYLLKPKTGGLAMALNYMEDRIQTMIDVTIIYHPRKQHSFWDYCCGNIQKIIVYVNIFTIPPELRGDVENDPEFRQKFQKFMHHLWQEKDDLIKRVYYNQ